MGSTNQPFLAKRFELPEPLNAACLNAKRRAILQPVFTLHKAMLSGCPLRRRYSVGRPTTRVFPVEIDGNKRTAFVAAEPFLFLNAYLLEAVDADCVLTMLRVAEGSVSEEDFAAWIRQNSTKRKK